jgi:protein phosphatase
LKASETLIALVNQMPQPDAKRILGTVNKRAVEKALAEALADARLSGMGTTMTLACNIGSDLVLAHVGDSRAYLVHNGELHRLTPSS